MKKENIIFSNLYGKHDESIKGALKRGDWKNISKILKLDKQDTVSYTHLTLPTTPYV